ncbi:MAG: carbamate kinase [Acidimicrobiia bacterium]
MVAETQGSIGYQLARALRNAFAGENIEVEVATLATQVVVDPDDPAFANPTKPVGPFYTASQESELRARFHWDLTEIPGRGWRRVVPSPSPLDIVELHTVADAATHGHIVIAGGGGGIPVHRTDRGELVGVEAVIDKDRTAALLAMKLHASAFFILTGVSEVYTSFGQADQEPIASMTVDNARRLLDEGEFPPGSMGPKVESPVAFVAATGNDALITDAEHLSDARARQAGTWIVP